MEIFDMNGKEVEGKVVEDTIEIKDVNIKLEDRNEETKCKFKFNPKLYKKLNRSVVEILNEFGKEIKGEVLVDPVKIKEENIKLEDKDEEIEPAEILHASDEQVEGSSEMKRKKIKLEIGGGNSCRPNGQPLLTPIRHRGNSRRQPFLTPFRRELKKIQRKIEASRLDEEDGWMEKKNRTLIEMEMDHVRQKQLLQLQFINQKRELELALEEETEKRDMIFIKQLLTLMQEATEKESSLKQELMEARREQLLKENIMRMRELVKSEIELENLD